MEDYVYVLDYLPKGRGDLPPFKRQPTVYGIGENQFTLLELVPRKNFNFNIGERIYVGKDSDKREKISKIKGRINYEELTSASKAELPLVIENIVIDNEKRFIEFINESQSLTPRMHSLELIPGIGKRLMFQILDLRERVPFVSYQDVKDRVNLTDPVKLIAKRVLKELSEDEKYYLFIRPMRE